MCVVSRAKSDQQNRMLSFAQIKKNCRLLGHGSTTLKTFSQLHIRPFKVLTRNSGGRGVGVGVSVMSSSGAVMRRKSMCFGLEG